MYGIIRRFRALLERLKAKFVTPQEPIVISTHQQIVDKCQLLVTLTQDNLHRRYNPLEAKLMFVRSTHPNILEFIKFLRKINQELGVTKPQLLQSEFPYNQTEIPLDAFFVSSSGNYIPQSAISDLVIEANTLLGFARTLAQAEAGIEEYHFRMLLKTIGSLTSIHGAISTVLAE